MKPVCIFTTFWDANAIIGNEYFIFVEGNKLYRCRLSSKNGKSLNYHVYSIALSHPPYKALPEIKKQFGDMIRLNCFCPTYEILNKYKNDKDWDYYTKQYRNILKQRKDSIKDWMDSLNPDTLYFLCCWENTKGESKCHRQLLYEAFKKSPTLNEKAFFVYRHGDKEESINKWNVFNLMEFPIGNSPSQESNTSTLSNQFVSINAGSPITLGVSGFAEAAGLNVGDVVGTVESSTADGSLVISTAGNGSNVFNELINNLFSATNMEEIEEEKDVEDFSLGDDMGDMP